MHFLKKDVNRRLLALIIFFLVIFIGFTVYYETTLRYVLAEKNRNEQLFGEFAGRAIMENLNNSNRVKELALMDKAVLDDKYTELQAQYDILKQDNSALTEQIVVLNSQLEYNKVKSDGPVAQFRLIQEKNEQLLALKEKLSALCTKLESANISDKTCR